MVDTQPMRLTSIQMPVSLHAEMRDVIKTSGTTMKHFVTQTIREKLAALKVAS